MLKKTQSSFSRFSVRIKKIIITYLCSLFLYNIYNSYI